MKPFDEQWEEQLQDACPELPWTPNEEAKKLARAAYTLLTSYGDVYVFSYGDSGVEIVVRPRTGLRTSIVILDDGRRWAMLQTSEKGTVIIPENMSCFDKTKPGEEESEGLD